MPRVSFAVPWFPFGPDGGDARSFAADPHDHLHVYLGTANGSIYDSHDGGRQWKRLARLGQRDDLVIDNIEVDHNDPKHLIVGVWVINHADGGIFISKDGGTTWTESPEMRGHSIRALTSAPSNHSILVAGALDGVYRSTDGGEHWSLISPAGSKEIHEIESLAIDPKDPQIIYAGTWHLPWKTTDGGANWTSIKQGILEDSDVFSIIVDPKSPNTVYASACSGIYKSENAGKQFSKVQGIPMSARRTRVLMQDPARAQIVFAGTTEGLFRTSDAGKTWIRNTPPDTIINDVYVDPEKPEHVLLATDRGGVLMSEDGGFTFRSSNKGFSARQISSFAQSHIVPAHIAVGVVNDKAYGGVFMSNDGGLTWTQRSDGLDGRDVFSLLRTGDDTLLAGTNRGVFKFSGERWVQSGSLLSAAAPSSHRGTKGRKHVAPRSSTRTSGQFDNSVYALASDGGTIYAAAGDDLILSLTSGQSWQTIPPMHGKDLRFAAVEGRRVLVGGLRSISLSKDAGKTWKEVVLPSELTLLSALSMDDNGNLWAGGREGLVYSTDDGASWQKIPNLFISAVNSIHLDRAKHRMLVTVSRPTLAYAIALPDHKVTYMETGWNLRFLRPVGDYLLGATLYDGVVLQPQMTASEISNTYKAAE
ncbi:MAG: hypothetical protein JSS87_04425 [Acidobacteria bacterium]|nr:hypothetical protein [Acidobacteriota bacterium]